MTKTLSTEFEISLVFSMEKHDRFGSQRTIFCHAETQHIDTRLPCCLGGPAAKESKRIGKTGAVHMQLHFVPLRYTCNRTNFLWSVARAHFGDLRDADGSGLGVVDRAYRNP